MYNVHGIITAKHKYIIGKLIFNTIKLIVTSLSVRGLR